MTYHRKVFNAIQAISKEYGAYTVLHTCGDNSRSLHDFVSTGIDILDIDHKMDLSFCKNEIGREVCLVGNINPVELHSSNEDVIKEKSNQCLKAAGYNGGFILGTGCFVPVGTHIENLKQMIVAAKNYKS